MVLLVPTSLKSVDASNRKTSLDFRPVLRLDGSVPTNIFNLKCATWTTVDGLDYGGISLDLLIFEGPIRRSSIPVIQTILKKVD